MLAKEDVYAFIDSLPHNVKLIDALCAVQEEFQISSASATMWIQNWLADNQIGVKQ